MIRAGSQLGHKIGKGWGFAPFVLGQNGGGGANPLSSIHFLHCCYHSQRPKGSEWQP